MYRTLIISLLLSTSIAFGALKAPNDKNIVQNQSDLIPILQCPSSNEFSTNMLSKLQDLKLAIKKDANCDGIEADVSSLKKLVTDDKDEFLGLIKKGSNQGLNAKDSTTIENYVTNLTTTTSSLIKVITGNDACFEEDKKVNSLAFITSLISEGSKLLGILDPTGHTVSLAGDVIVGFMKGMTEVQKVGYDFRLHDQRAAFNQSLCSFYDYRQEIDQYIFTNNQTDRLHELDLLLANQIQLIKNNCPECSELVQHIDVANRRTSNSNTQDWNEQDDAEIKARAKMIDSFYEKKIGTSIYSSAKSRRWIKYRVETLSNTRFRADLNMQTALEQLSSIEKFMIYEQAPKFLKYEIKEAMRLRLDLIKLVMTKGRHEVYRAYGKLGIPLPKSTYGTQTRYANKPLHKMSVSELFDIINYLDQAIQKHGDIRSKNKLRTFMGEIETLMVRFSTTAENSVRYCDFFLHSRNWYPEPEISSVCEGKGFFFSRGTSTDYLASELTALEQSQINSIRRFKKNLLSQRRQTPRGDGRSSRITGEAAAHDWLDSLTYALQTEAPNFNSLRRRWNPATNPMESR